MVLVQGGGTLLAECKNTLWMIIEAEENASKSPSPLQTPDTEIETGGFSDSQGSGNVSPTVADMELMSKHRIDGGKANTNYQEKDHVESELCSACFPTADGVKGFQPVQVVGKCEASSTEEDLEMAQYSDCVKFVETYSSAESESVNSGMEVVEGAVGDRRKGLLEDVDLLQGAEVFPPPMAPLNRCFSKGKGKTDTRDCKCKIVFKKCKGKRA